MIVLNAALSAGVLAFSQTPLDTPRPARKIHSVAEMSKMMHERFAQQETQESFSDQEVEPDFLEPESPPLVPLQRRHIRNSSLDISSDFSPARLTRFVKSRSLFFLILELGVYL